MLWCRGLARQHSHLRFLVTIACARGFVAPCDAVTCWTSPSHGGLCSLCKKSQGAHSGHLPQLAAAARPGHCLCRARPHIPPATAAPLPLRAGVSPTWCPAAALPSPGRNALTPPDPPASSTGRLITIVEHLIGGRFGMIFGGAGVLAVVRSLGSRGGGRRSGPGGRGSMAQRQGRRSEKGVRGPGREDDPLGHRPQGPLPVPVHTHHLHPQGGKNQKNAPTHATHKPRPSALVFLLTHRHANNTCLSAACPGDYEP